MVVSRLAVSVSVINRVEKRVKFWRSMNFSMRNLHETLLSAPSRMKKRLRRRVRARLGFRYAFKSGRFKWGAGAPSTAYVQRDYALKH